MSIAAFLLTPACRRLGLLAIGVLSLGLAGCVTLPRESFTAAEQLAASPPGFGNVRYIQEDPALAAMLRRAMKANPRGEVSALALSGGGANGAYGAGLIYSWSKSGTEPEFQLVTGVSTGALAAPFAFLGPRWNERLRESYAGANIQHLLKGRGLYGLFTPGLYSRAPLEQLVRRYVTDDLIQAVAAENVKGRRLLVATTNLDTEHLIIWDMGAIAAHGGSDARELFVQVLVASASVPGVFPPTMIKVEGGGRAFAEMHVDGQTESAFYAVPQTLLLAKVTQAAPFRVRLYIVVNGQLDSRFAVTPRSTIPILSRTMDAANKASIRSVLISTAEFCQQKRCDLFVSALPKTVKDDPLDFSAKHIKSLFAAGEAAQVGGDVWMKSTP
jgi:predicted acylesterase/phospholipase RssA